MFHESVQHASHLYMFLEMKCLSLKVRQSNVFDNVDHRPFSQLPLMTFNHKGEL